jgi:hypothetical protein
MSPSNHKNRKVFPLVVWYFEIENRLLDFSEQADETASGIHNLIESSLDMYDTKRKSNFI